MHFPQLGHGFVEVAARYPAETQEQVARLDAELVQRDVDESLTFDEELVQDEEVDLLGGLCLESGQMILQQGTSNSFWRLCGSCADCMLSNLLVQRQSKT